MTRAADMTPQQLAEASAKAIADLRAAHERNDEVLERIYIGRRFKNDTERLEKLFDLYTKMTAATSKTAAPKAAPRKRGETPTGSSGLA